MKHFIISVAALLILTSSFTLRAQEYDTLSIHRNEKGISQLNVSDLRRGLYIIKVYKGDLQLTSKIILK